jgi:methyl-accepting chemotaxis protein
MNRLSPQAVLALVSLVAWAAVFATPVPHTIVVGLAGGFLTAIAILWAASGGAAGAPRGLGDAVRRAASGERPTVPADAPPEWGAVYDEIGRVAEATRSLRDDHDRARKALDELEQKRDELRDAKDELRKLQAELARERELSTSGKHDSSRRRAEVVDLVGKLDEHSRRLQETVQGELSMAAEGGRRARDVMSALKEIGRNVETLAHSAEESSSSILQLTSTNDEVAENVGELAASVRETVGSIEEMTFSIKEVAKNVDALSLTAEETSSSMNEMDVSID